MKRDEHANRARSVSPSLCVGLSLYRFPGSMRFDDWIKQQTVMPMPKG